MPAIFVHLSDIHFGQERDDTVHIHDDMKQQLITDAAEVIGALPGATAHGVLVTGDIAYSGKRPQYDDAGRWLDELAGRIGCPIHRVQMVPGNHDVDREKLSIGGSQLLDYIRAGGAAEYEKVVGNPADRASLLARFEDYGSFSFGYDCALDGEVRFATNLRVELAPGRWIRFIRMNSSLLCHGKERDDAPELMIGARQFTIPRHGIGTGIASHVNVGQHPVAVQRLPRKSRAEAVAHCAVCPVASDQPLRHHGLLVPVSVSQAGGDTKDPESSITTAIPAFHKAIPCQNTLSKLPNRRSVQHPWPATAADQTVQRPSAMVCRMPSGEAPNGFSRDPMRRWKPGLRNGLRRIIVLPPCDRCCPIGQGRDGRHHRRSRRRPQVPF